MKKSEYPKARRAFHWDRARIKFGLAGDDVYDDDAAEHWAEEEMLHEALTRWDKGNADEHSSRQRRYQWWNQSPLRDLATEQQLFLLELDEKLRSKAPRRKTKRGR
jgi:hypothetical protein